MQAVRAPEKNKVTSSHELSAPQTQVAVRQNHQLSQVETDLQKLLSPTPCPVQSQIQCSVKTLRTLTRNILHMSKNSSSAASHSNMSQVPHRSNYFFLSSKKLPCCNLQLLIYHPFNMHSWEDSSSTFSEDNKHHSSAFSGLSKHTWCLAAPLLQALPLHPSPSCTGEPRPGRPSLQPASCDFCPNPAEHQAKPKRLGLNPTVVPPAADQS